MFFVLYEAVWGAVFEERKKHIFNPTKIMQGNFLDPSLAKSVFEGNF
jgi:hypothetical protein